MTQPRLVFCVGATKAGTSWLHRYLSDHAECHLRAIKEVHYFDALEFGEMDRQAERMREFRDWLIAEMAPANERRRANLQRQLPHAEHLLKVFDQGAEDVAAYLDYLAEGRGDRRVLADVTPAYGLVSEGRLRQMAGVLPDVRFVYLLRDPVARLWSHIRMMAARRAHDPSEIPGRASNILSRLLRGKEEQIEMRSDYAGTLRRLRGAVATDRFLPMFYEDMFTPAGLSRLCGFLGIAPNPADFAKRIHSGPDHAASAQEIATMRDWLAPQYDFVARDMGVLPDAWEIHTIPPGGRNTTMKV